MGKVRRQTAGAAAFDEDLIVSAYCADVDDIPVLGDLDGFQDLANMLRLRAFRDLPTD